MEKRIEATISGRVQLVMFRDFVKRKARRLSLTGTVTNMVDGSVKVEAEGSEENLKKLIKLLHGGPILARVEAVDVVWSEPKYSFGGFNIIY